MGSNNQATVEDRVMQVADWLLVPYTSSEIVRLCATEWQVHRATAFEYIRKANERIVADNSDDLAAEIIKAKERLERITRKAEEDKEYQASIAAQRELNKLMGLAAPEKTEVKHNVTDEFLGVFRNVVKASDQPA